MKNASKAEPSHRSLCQSNEHARSGGRACRSVELVHLADLLVEHGRGRVAAQLADAAREWPGGVPELRVRPGGRRDDGIGNDRWFVAAPDRFGEQRVERFAASRIDGKRLIGEDG